MKKKKEGKSVASQVGAGLATAAGAMLKKGKKHLSDDYQYSDWRDDFKAMEYEFIDLIKPEPLVSEGAMPDPIDSKKHRDASKQSKINNMKRSDNPNEREVANKKLTPAAKVDTPLTPANKFKEFSKNTAPKEKPRGPKLMGEVTESETYVRGTAPVRDPQTRESYPRETYFRKTYKKKSKEKEVKVDEKYQGMYQSPAPTHNRLMSSDEKARMSPGLRAMRRSDELERSEFGSKRQKKQKKASMQMARNFQSARATKEEVETIDEAGKKCWKGYKKAGTQKLFGKTYNRCVKANEEFVNEAKDETEEGITGGPIRKKKRSPKKQHDFEKERRSERKKRGEFEKVGDNFSRHRMTGSRGHGTGGDNPRISYIRNQYEIESDWRSEIEEGAAWTKKSGKNPSGGLNEKGRKSYERENPGSDLKRPSKKKGNKRRASFCARMKGMKKKLTSSKTANDPDSRINKSLRAWNC